MPELLSCGATIATPDDEPGSLITRPRQIEFAGLLLGAGTPYRWKGLTGWDDEPGIDLSDATRDTADGDYPGMGVRQARIVSLDLAVHADTPDDMETLCRLLRQRAAFRSAEEELHIADTGQHLWALGRVIQRALPHTPGRTVGVLEGVALQWKATDPRRFTTTRRSVRIKPAIAGGGLGYPVEYPSDYGTPGGTGGEYLPNDGDAEAGASPVVTFRGPAKAGYGIGIGDAWLRYDLPLTAAEFLTVDTRTGTVLLNGTVDRSSWINPLSVSPESWRIPPGGADAAVSVPQGATAATAVDVEWSDTLM